MEMQKQAMMAQQQLKAQELAAQTAMQKIQLESQSKMQLKQAEVAFDIEKLKAEAEMKRMLMNEEFQYQMQIAGVKESAITTREDMKEKKKSRPANKNETISLKPVIEYIEPSSLRNGL